MKNYFLGMAAISAIAAAAPAAAQYQSNTYPAQNTYQNQNSAYANGNIAARIEQLRIRLQAGIQSGVITRREAVPLRQQLRTLTQLERQYSYNGLTGQERANLMQRLRTLRQQMRLADGGARGRYDQEDRYEDDYYGQNGQYDRIDRNNDGYDDRVYDRDGRWDDDVNQRIDGNNDGYDDRDYDRDGRWDDDVVDDRYEQPAQRGGLGGLIDSVLGTGGLRVGQRASANLYAVPYEYRNQYRDGNGVYYRSDGRHIYQIDARTQTVVRIYPMN